MLHQTVALLKQGVYKEFQQRIEYMSWYICDRLLNPRRATDTVKLIDEMRDHESEMLYLKDSVLENMEHEVQLCADMHRNNSYTVCDILDFDIAKIRHEFCWNHGNFVHVHLFLTGANKFWYAILEHLDKLRLINLTRTTTEFWPDIHGTTKPVNLNFNLDNEIFKSEFDPPVPPVE